MPRKSQEKGAEASSRPEKFPLEKMPSKDEIIDIDVAKKDNATQDQEIPVQVYFLIVMLDCDVDHSYQDSWACLSKHA